jgi:antitoxin component of RelBE/YafQ-DinJ toxin-antitoxin module
MELKWAVKQKYDSMIRVRLPFRAKHQLQLLAKITGLTISDLIRIFTEYCLSDPDILQKILPLRQQQPQSQLQPQPAQPPHNFYDEEEDIRV